MSEDIVNNYDLVVYLDDKYLAEVKVKPERKNITVIPINEVILNLICPIWQRLAREQQIMLSKEYREAFASRLIYPENSNPKYTLINHAKIDFLIHAQDISSADFFCWIDFGYKEPAKYPIDLNRIDQERINYALLNPVDDLDKNVMYTMLHAPEKITGGFFIGRRDKLRQYQELYHDAHAWFQANNLADDDQHIVLRCYFAEPDLFKLHLLRGWYKMTSLYQLRKNNVISWCLWGNNELYTTGLIENIKLSEIYYPGWENYIYLHTDTVSAYIIEKLKEFPNVKIIPKSGKIRPTRNMLWRIEPADDPCVKRFISRDADSRITPREVIAVREWVNSEKTLHILRDHPQHYPKILGGMFGLKLDNICLGNNNICEWAQKVDNFYSARSEATDDQDFLLYFYEAYKNDRIIHDEIKKYEGKECLPYALGYTEDAHFIGCRVGPDNIPDVQTTSILKAIMPGRISAVNDIQQGLMNMHSRLDYIYVFGNVNIKNTLLDIAVKVKVKEYLHTRDNMTIDFIKKYMNIFTDNLPTLSELATKACYYQAYKDISEHKKFSLIITQNVPSNFAYILYKTLTDNVIKSQFYPGCYFVNFQIAERELNKINVKN